MAGTFYRNERGAVPTINGANAFLPDDPAYAGAARAFETLVSEHNRLSEVMKPEAVAPALLTSSAGRDAIATSSVTFGTLLTRKREYEAADRNARERAPAIADTRGDAEWRGMYRTLDRAQQATRIATAGLAELAAVVAEPDLADLDPALRDRANERFLALNFADRVGLAGNYPNRPSIGGNLLATGVDEAAVETAAREALARHVARGEQAEADEQNLRGIVGLLAVAFEMQPGDVLEKVQP